ncbi:MAG TPA: hypothetical protein VHQ01_13175 [Pyrinomonadaceae bacterium]|nr:hypothetical protein [Pyrinomonadaceae bacterium]
MERSSKWSIWLFLMTFSFVFYGMGASFVESFINYPTWKLIGPNEFLTYHHAASPLIIGYLVAPMVFGTFLTSLLLWFRPRPIPAWTLWLALGLQIFVWISTVAIQIPIQIELSSSGLSIPAIDKLLVTNFWFRRIPYTISAALFVWMMSLLLRRHYAGPTKID